MLFHGRSPDGKETRQSRAVSQTLEELKARGGGHIIVICGGVIPRKDYQFLMDHGVSAVFGERAGSIPISSNKSMIGHTLTAAGAIEAIFTLMSISRGVLPPTINYDTPDPTVPIDCVPNVARPAKVRHAISNSFGFGGQNVCVVLGAAP